MAPATAGTSTTKPKKTTTKAEDPLKGLTVASIIKHAPTLIMTLDWEGRDTEEEPLRFEIEASKSAKGSVNFGLSGQKFTFEMSKGGKRHDIPVSISFNATVSNSKKLPEGSDSDDSDDQPIPAKGKATKKSKAKEASETDEEEESRPKKKAKKSKAKDEDFEEEPEEKKEKKKKTTKKVASASEEADEKPKKKKSKGSK